MSTTTLQELQTALATVQDELNRVKGRLDELEKVVSIDHDQDGIRRVYLECTDFVLRPAEDPRQIALHLGEQSGAGYMQVHYPNSPHAAVEIAVHEDGEPHVQLIGRDFKTRTEIFIRDDCGWAAVLSTGGTPGALMRAQPDGGSVAVLQADGAARGVLVHSGSENLAPESEGQSVSTNLIFADGQRNTILKLRADDDGGMLTAGTAGQADAIALISRPDGPALMMHSPNEDHSISLMAMNGLAEICVHEDKVPGTGTQTSLMAGEFGSSLTLRGIGGQKSVDISALDVASSLTMHDAQGDVRVMLAHHFGSHSALTLQSVTDEEGLRAIASAEVTSIEIISPVDPHTKVLTAVTAEKAVTIVQKHHRPIVMFGEGDQGGVICAYGPTAESAGIASISGGPVAGSVVLATVDGTAQLTLDATDHGGRMLINNDLGFQRVAMGVYEEAGGLHLNNTGSIGIQAVATPKGGVVTVSDHDGRPIASLPESDGEDPGDWGKLPDSF
ncbi:MAG: hypothetical protein ABL974_18590 [Prosthecobacter sp.]